MSQLDSFTRRLVPKTHCPTWTRLLRLVVCMHERHGLSRQATLMRFLIASMTKPPLHRLAVVPRPPCARGVKLGIAAHISALLPLTSTPRLGLDTSAPLYLLAEARCSASPSVFSDGATVH
ncbi:hypothetical protein D9619_008314 [Psilocybe cf. subviscida]|uniref:Uncharacterized protein n=1 Tax=Psilocybe cf. subviscida TaxID=2480587 RepID=A0A8H5F0W3_9AGAR|nr:hypothetical protein D9619_008314 [Psilocybe cf. subviscida]